MEANKYTVQEGTSAMESATKDKKLGLDELRSLNSKNVKSMTEWVEREKKALTAPARRPNDDSHEADVQFIVDMNGHKEFKSVLDSFDAQITALKEAYANSKEELKSATADEISKFEASIGIAPEKKDLFAGVSPGDKIEAQLNDGNGETTKAIGSFSKVENGKLFMKMGNGKEYDISPVSSVKSITKADNAPEATEGKKAEAAGKPQAAEAAKADNAPEAKAKTEHTVSKGETLSGIAKKYGVSVAELTAANGIEDANKISIGKKLSVPEGGAATKEAAAKRPQAQRKPDKGTEKPSAKPEGEAKPEEPKKESDNQDKPQKTASEKYGTSVPGVGGIRDNSPIARMNGAQKEDPKGGRTNLEFIASGDAGKGNPLPGTKKA